MGRDGAGPEPAPAPPLPGTGERSPDPEVRALPDTGRARGPEDAPIGGSGTAEPAGDGRATEEQALPNRGGFAEAGGGLGPAPETAGVPQGAPGDGDERAGQAEDSAREAPGPEGALRVAGGAVAPGAAAPGAGSGVGTQGPESDTPGGDARFTVRLANFEGPFDLLLQLIAKHKLDVTEVALSKVTDEFMAHIRAMGADWDLDQTTEFLVVAATLLDLKAARLLPAAEVEDEADLALLEARDLLFARLLQYRAYKQIAEIFDRRLDDEARRFPRTVGLEQHHAELLPDVVISIGAEGFAKLAVKAMQPRPKPQVYVDHIHAPLVSVREQAEVVVALLRERGTATFRELTEGVDDTLTVVARFLALLELYREKALVLDQEVALGELTVTWAAGDGTATVTVTDEFDHVVEEKE
ncbi:segregation/condensation protein A [Streptomyces sp. ISL-10]|uniref:segregation and condensation protein A n=1 Tax=Streptomyces sp. ISL-10 TaxID=2819172 RepID=UPI0027E4794B|nr:segregation/condensation protein A [Streptomyces sp. ISL-10]